MKLIFITLFIVAACAVSLAQTEVLRPPGDYPAVDEKGCLKPEAESQTYAFRKGKVTKIASADKILFNQGGKEYRVNLVGIDGNFNEKEIVAFLKENVLNREIEFMANSRSKSGNELGGSPMLFNDAAADIDEINEYLLENGIARYKNFDSANLVPGYISCRLENAEKRAKEAKIGIWAK